MTAAVQLDRLLDDRTNGSDTLRAAVNDTVLALAGAGATIADLISAGRLAGDLAALHGESAHGDSQKELDHTGPRA